MELNQAIIHANSIGLTKGAATNEALDKYMFKLDSSMLLLCCEGSYTQ